MARARRNWTPEEDAALQWAVNTALTQSRPLLWRELAKSVPGRSNKDCRRRWWNSLAVGIDKGPWSEREDERLIKAVFKHGFSWNRVAQAVMSRNPDQCSSHWSQALDPGINHYDWTPTEDLQLLHAVLTHGTNWAAISSSHVPKRTGLALKNRYSTLRLCDEHNGSKPKKQIAATTSNISPIGSLGATTMQGSPMSEARKSPDIQGHDSDKIAGGDDGEEDNEDDEDDEDEDENIESRYRRYGDEDESRVSHSQYMGKPNSHARRLDLKSTRPRAQDEFAERGGDGILLDTNSLHYDRVAPLPTPTATETWTTETADDMSSDKNIFLSSNPQSPPLDLPRDYSRFFGAVQEPGATTTHVSYTPYNADALDMRPSPTRAPSYPPLSHSTAILPTDMSTTTSGRAPYTQKGPKDRDNASTTYQITLDMVCTGAQIESVMTGLEGVGASVTMRIEPRPSSNFC